MSKKILKIFQIEATIGTKKTWYQKWFKVSWDKPYVVLYEGIDIDYGVGQFVSKVKNIYR